MKQKKLAVQISSRIVYDEKKKNYGRENYWDHAVETVRKINERTDCKASLYDL